LQKTVLFMHALNSIIDIVHREEAEWAIEIQGFLGILNILGIEHLMVIVGIEEVCKIHHKL